MKSSELRRLIKECILEVIAERAVTRVCPYCDLLKPVSDENKSHGIACKQHAIPAMMRDWNMSEQQAQQLFKNQMQKNPDAFSPNTSGAKETDPLPELPRRV